MKLALVGVGGAGGRIAQAIRQTERESGRTMTDGHVLVFDTDREALDGLDRISPERRISLGGTYDGVEGTGVDGDSDLGAEIADVDDYEIQRSFDDVPIEELDGMLVVAGLGGGTGGGTGAAILQMCQELFDFPVYGAAVLPHEDEGDDVALTAARALLSFVRLADNVFVFDNDTWAADDGDYDEANEILATRLVGVLSLGDFDGAPAESRVDRTDIMRTLETGGVTAIGMDTWTIDLGWRRWFRWLPWVGLPPRDADRDASRLKNLVRRAVETPLTVPCDIASTERALVVTAGPPSVLSRKGFESARYWLEQELETVEIIAGDEPRPKDDAVTALVVLSNVTDVPRIEALKEQGLAAKQLTDAE